MSVSLLQRVFRAPLIISTVTFWYRSVVYSCRRIQIGLYGVKLNLRNSFRASFIKGGILLSIAPALTMSAKSVDISEVIKESDQLLDNNQIKEAFELLSAHKDVDNPNIQWRFARICYRYGKYVVQDQNQAKEISQLGLVHADRAVSLDPNCYAAYRWRGVLLNWSIQFEGYKKQIEKSFEIRDNFAKACELKPTDATARHLLGRWCYEVSNVPWYMKKAAQYIFATPPNSSYDDALANFQKAEELNPGFYCTNWLYIAKCYIALGKKDQAKPWLEKTAQYSQAKDIILLGDDLEAINEAEKLLKTI